MSSEELSRIQFAIDSFMSQTTITPSYQVTNGNNVKILPPIQ